MNKEEYLDAKEGNMVNYRTQRHGPQLPLADNSYFSMVDCHGSSRQFQATEENLKKVLTAFGMDLSAPTELVRLPRDQYQAELDVISHVCAYFDISSKRLIDEIPQVFETVFAGDFGKTLAADFTTKLNLVGEKGLENCVRYIRDEPDVQAKRDNLTRMRGILENARNTFDRFYK